MARGVADDLLADGREFDYRQRLIVGNTQQFGRRAAPACGAITRSRRPELLEEFLLLCVEVAPALVIHRSAPLTGRASSFLSTFRIVSDGGGAVTADVLGKARRVPSGDQTSADGDYWAASSPIATDWSPNGDQLVVENPTPGFRSDLWLVPLGGGAKPKNLIGSPGDQMHGNLSPDG